MPKTTPELRGKIIGMYESGELKSTIAEKLKLNPKTVSLWIKRHEEEGNLNCKERGHKEKCTTRTEDEKILEYVKNNPMTTTVEIRRKLKINCSAQTILRRMKENKINHYTPAIKPALSINNKEQRLGFALQYISEDNEFWRKVIFTDEKTFSTSDQTQKHVYRLKNTRYEEKNISTNRRSGRIDLGFWGWVSGDVVGELVPIEGKFTGEKYLEILEQVLIPTVKSVYSDFHVIFLVEDNSPIHRSKIVRNWINNRKDIIRIDWPANSPDLNIIENIWKLVVKDWDITKTRNKENLKEHVIKSWESLREKPDLMSNYSNTMQRRLIDVIKVGGGYTKY